MPYSVNGIGTGLVAASKKRVVEGHVQFDAMEALMVFYCPVAPYKTLHVLSLWSDAEGEQYQSVNLRFSPRLVLKAFLNRWGNVLTAFGALMAVIAGFAFATMERQVTSSDVTFLSISVAMFLVGLVFKLSWWLLDRRDERIKDLLGPHDLGSSDPLYWTEDAAQAVTLNILQQQGQSSLSEVIRQAVVQGNPTQAMLCTRLAMRDNLNMEAETYYRQLLHA